MLQSAHKGPPSGGFQTAQRLAASNPLPKEEFSTLDFVLSQGSGNAALCIWMLACSLWAGRQIRNTEE